MDPQQQAALDAMDPETRAKTIAAMQAVEAMRQKPTEEQIIANAQARQAAAPVTPAAPPDRHSLAAQLAPALASIGLGSQPPSAPLPAPVAASTPDVQSVVAAPGTPAGPATPAQAPLNINPVEIAGAPGAGLGQPVAPMTFENGRFSGGTPQSRAAGYDKEADRLNAEGDEHARSGQATNVFSKEVEADQRSEFADQAEKTEELRQKAYKTGTDELQRLRQKHEAYADELRKTSIDPDRFFKSANAATKFGLGISLITGGFLQGSKGLAMNPGLKMLQDSIDVDIRAQEKGAEYLSRATDSIAGAVTDQRQALVEQREGAALKRQVFWENAQKELDARAARFGAQTDAKAYEAASSWIQAKKMAEQANLERMRMQAAASAAAGMLKKHEEQEKAIAKQTADYEALGDEHEKAMTRARSTITGSYPTGADGKVIPLGALPGAKGMEPTKPATPEMLKFETEQNQAVEGARLGMKELGVAKDAAGRWTSKIPYSTDQRNLDGVNQRVAGALASAGKEHATADVQRYINDYGFKVTDTQNERDFKTKAWENAFLSGIHPSNRHKLTEDAEQAVKNAMAERAKK